MNYAPPYELKIVQLEIASLRSHARKWATLAATGQTLEEVAELRLNELSIAGDGHE
ncbi:hypothetical protein [Sphingomonas sp. YL-JM2C]